MAAKKEKFAIILPPDLFFYVIPFTSSNQYLTKEDLGVHFPIPKGWKVYLGNHEKFTDFENGVAIVETKLSDLSENTLYLHIEPKELHVACTCGMPGETLCFHAFMGLYQICYQSSGFNFGQLYWPGYDSRENIRKFLEVEYSTYRAMKLSPKPQYGLIYRQAIGFAGNKPPNIEAIKRMPVINAGDTAVIAYSLCYTPGRFNRHYPLLMPFYGMTAKDGLKINSFVKFILPDQPTAIAYPPMHQELSEIAKSMYGIIKPLGEHQKNDDKAWKEAKPIIFELWVRALPFLSGMPYTYSYPLYWLRYLKERPYKAQMSQCAYSQERAALTFDLTFHKDHFSLTAVVTAGSKIINFDHKPYFFVMDKDSGYCYLMNSVQDDDLLNWMMDNNNKITFLKADFQEVDKTFLNRLHDKYRVLYISRKGKRLIYDYNLIKSDLGF